MALNSKLVSVLEDWQKRCVPTPGRWLFADADTKRPVYRRATCYRQMKRSCCLMPETANPGLPYSVMEFVEAHQIDGYSDTHALSVRQRVTLFRSVCSGTVF